MWFLKYSCHIHLCNQYTFLCTVCMLSTWNPTTYKFYNKFMDFMLIQRLNVNNSLKHSNNYLVIYAPVEFVSTFFAI